MKSKWAEVSFNLIMEKFREIKKETPDLSNEDIFHIINKQHYPFGQRVDHPYKMWKKALRQAKGYVLTLTLCEKEVK